MRFEWGERKAKENLRKHGVSFDEATTVFADPMSVTIPDPEHSDDEDRFVDVGYSDKSRLLVVVYTERSEQIRVISCRKATARERQTYEEGQH
jgi:uncharacterized DUF497 family protein